MQPHPEVLEQAANLVDIFASHPRLKSRHGRKSSRSRDLADAIATKIETIDVLSNPKALPYLECYVPRKPEMPRIRLSKEIARGKHMRVFRGQLQDGNELRDVAVKWYGRDSDDATKDEITIYQKLYRSELPKEAVALGLSKHCSLPEFSRLYYLWGHPVLVLQWLQPLQLGEEHEANLIPVILRQLAHLHRFGVHCGLKPENIMQHRGQYYLIDYGGCATKRQKDGSYRRWTWTKHWASQERHDSHAFAKHDLLELANTACTIQKARRGVRNKNPREGYHGRLLKFVQMINAMDNEIRWKDYAALIALYESSSVSKVHPTRH